MLIVFFGAEMITRLMKTPLSIFALKVLAPTLVVMAVLGVMRGFFQGLGTMMPSAVSQIIEQIINAIVSVWAAYLLADYGNKVGAVLGNGEDYAAAYGAAGGTLGTALGAVFALLFSIFVFATYVPVFKNRMNNSRTKKNESYGSIMRILIMTIVPVLLSTTIYNISSVIDQGIYKNVALLQGSTNRQMDELWGIFSGKYKVLINVPISIASAMAASCVPSLAAAYAKKGCQTGKKPYQFVHSFYYGHRISVRGRNRRIGISDHAAVIRGRRQRNRTDASDRSRIYRVLFSVDVNECIIAGSKPDAGTGKKCVDCVSTAYYRSACMHVWTEPWYLFRGHRQCVFALFMCTLNRRSLKRYTRYRQEVGKTFIVPAISSAIMGVAVFFAYDALHKLIHSNAISTVVCIALGGVVYIVCLFLFKGLSEEELINFPKGATLVRIFKKLHLLR